MPSKEHAIIIGVGPGPAWARPWSSVARAKASR